MYKQKTRLTAGCNICNIMIVMCVPEYLFRKCKSLQTGISHPVYKTIFSDLQGWYLLKTEAYYKYPENCESRKAVR